MATCLVCFSLGHPGCNRFQGKSDLLCSKIRRCSMGSALVRLRHVSFIFRLVARRSGLSHGRSDILLFVLRSACAIGESSTSYQVSLTCRPGTRRSDLSRGRSDLRSTGSAGVVWAPLYRVPGLVYFSPGHSEDGSVLTNVDLFVVSRIRRCGGLQPARLWAKSRLLVPRVPIGPIYNKAIPM